MSSTGTTGSSRPAELTLPEISVKFAGRWVAMEVTKRDRNLQPVKGRVVADEIDRYVIREKAAKYKDICIFYAGELPYHLLL